MIRRARAASGRLAPGWLRGLGGCVGLVLMAGTAPSQITFEELDGLEDFVSNWPARVERTWIGPEYTAHPAAHWRLSEGRLECLQPGASHAVHLLSRRFGKHPGIFSLRMQCRSMALEEAGAAGWIGFRIGAAPARESYGVFATVRGVPIGMRGDGHLVIGNHVSEDAVDPSVFREGFQLWMEGGPVDTGSSHLAATAASSGISRDQLPYRIRLDVTQGLDGRVLLTVEQLDIPPDGLVGDLAVTAHLPGLTWEPDEPAVQFEDLVVLGDKLDDRPGAVRGPVRFAVSTLQDHRMLVTAQCEPLSDEDGGEITLEGRLPDESDWTALDQVPVTSATKPFPCVFDTHMTPPVPELRIRADLVDDNGFLDPAYFALPAPRQPGPETRVDSLPAGYLPLLDFGEVARPHIEVVEETTHTRVAVFPAPGSPLRVPVFSADTFTVRLTHPITKSVIRIHGLAAAETEDERIGVPW